ncbi:MULTISPECIES: putative DNA modification/repair radical SAM protein [unclassified Roseateles]|uniref:putative DNA modification/repair radical SAM protein n=1 Tax=unclassified Roseateles TaxID=2626991 RepID=UPI0007000F92|nr:MULTISPECIES: putative DNA modification/repair radical SAM protein [unclassified Roseateles]KQW48189.1 biotin synthase [Pelomonas sp. Root405]KRA75371.1 biotin synthase [Pelomonas sp. Root662]
MDVNDKLAVLADAAKYDASCASSGGDKRDSRDGHGIGSTTGAGICHAFTPDGRCVSLLKVLLTNWCVYDCLYCINRKSSDVRRARFSIDEIVQLTLSFYRRNVIEGLFLSSGIIRTPDYTMEQAIEVARRLREQEHFKGYIHLKTIPDAAPELVERAGRYADRLSINVELPSAASLKQLAPEKNADGIERTMSRIHLRLQAAKEARREAETVRALPGANARTAKPPPFAPAGQSTQLIVGADASDDRAVLQLSHRLYRGQGLRRVYYSAYSPIPHASAALPPQAAPLMREHRLYQADWLMRFYGFGADEIVTEAGFLSLQHDPKLAWALAHPASFPLDVDRAPREQLLRVPGLGVGSVDKLLAARLRRRLRRADLLALGPAAKRALPFLVAIDHRPRATDVQMLARPAAQPQQAALF